MALPKSQLEKRVDALEAGAGGDCVGKWLDEAHTSVAFNDHKFNKSNTRYDIMSGFRNTIYNEQAETSQYPISGYNDVGGDWNNVYNSSEVFCRGHGNTVGCTTADGGYGSCRAVSVQGNSNRVIRATYAEVCGDSNTVTSGSRFFLGGYKNTVGYLYSSNVSGENHNLGQINYSVITGRDMNCSNVGYSVIAGQGHTGTAVDSLVGGTYGSLINNRPLMIGGGTGSSPQNVFTVDTNGNVQAAGNYGTMGADYAEYFEWADGNPDNEDRRGMLVALDGDKLVPAHGDDFIGIVSANPSVVGNAYELYWHGKYAVDVFGNVITAPDGTPLISPDFDPAQTYIPRSQRKEWAAIGLTGRLVIIDNGSCKPGGYASARNGIGTASLHETRARVLRRVNSTHVEVLIR